MCVFFKIYLFAQLIILSCLYWFVDHYPLGLLDPFGKSVEQIPVAVDAASVVQSLLGSDCGVHRPAPKCLAPIRAAALAIGEPH